jgi:hypothetical protein
MTQSDWTACTDPAPMLEFLRGKASDRKLRLCACACVRRIWHLLTDDRSRQAVATAEKFADGLATERDLEAAQIAALRAAKMKARPEPMRHHDQGLYLRAANAATGTTNQDAWWAASTAPDTAARAAGIESGAKGPAEDPSRAGQSARLLLEHRRAQTAILLDVFDNPFRAVTVSPLLLTWRNSTIPALAQSIYDNRSPSGTLDPARLSELASLLGEAGCQDAELLEHLRGPGPHIRGCWVVDLLLGKS